MVERQRQQHPVHRRDRSRAQRGRLLAVREQRAVRELDAARTARGAGREDDQRGRLAAAPTARRRSGTGRRVGGRWRQQPRAHGGRRVRGGALGLVGHHDGGRPPDRRRSPARAAPSPGRPGRRPRRPASRPARPRRTPRRPGSATTTRSPSPTPAPDSRPASASTAASNAAQVSDVPEARSRIASWSGRPAAARATRSATCPAGPEHRRVRRTRGGNSARCDSSTPRWGVLSLAKTVAPAARTAPPLAVLTRRVESDTLSHQHTDRA